MYDVNHWWYTEMEREHLKERMFHLSLDQLVVYSVGCVTHANEVVRANIQNHEHADFQATVRLLRLFWDGYPQTVSGGNLASIATKAEEVVTSELGPEPDEKFLQAPGAEPLLWATLYGLTSARNATPIVSAYSALGRSYFAVYTRFAMDEQAINEGRMHEIERATPQCMAELTFQMNYLRFLEESKSLPANYSEVSACADAG